VFFGRALAEARREVIQLGQHGRYSHTRPYLEQVMSDAGFGPPGIDAVVLRRNWASRSGATSSAALRRP